ncbi:insulinase family protein [Paracoccus suum]|uniref:Insulinase family protein n=1 Tax=Paracoccus suum TaxID=2259340 RepID=A0A344PHK2_9RHOB|nr:insulinase family protein [Paracoccus suum]
MRHTLAPLLLASTVATPALADAPPGISHFTLPNGLETVVIEDHRAPVVVQMVWYKIGAADEKPGKSGIAHYLEHLMFKGTDKVAAGDLSKIVAKNGGMDNAFTSSDFTTYFQRIASDRLPLVMEMEADRMQNLRIGEDDWQAERQVVLEERAQRTDSDPGSQFGEERDAAQYLNHPYGRPVIGWKQEMEGLTREDALAWYQAHYAPNDAVLVLAGDVTPQKARELAEKFYGPIPARGETARAARPQEPPQRTPRRLTLSDPRVPQPTMIRTILAPERNRGDQARAAALTVLAEVLAGSPQTSVLGRELVLGGTALSVNASYDGTSVDPTTFGLSLVPADGVTPEDAEAKLDAALAKFAQEGPSEAEMARVRVAIEAQRIYAQDSAHGRAYEYGQGLAVGLRVEDVNDWPDILSAVTADDVRLGAAELNASPARVTGWLMPGEAIPVAASGADPLPAPPAAGPAEVPPAQAQGAAPSPGRTEPAPAGTPPASDGRPPEMPDAVAPEARAADVPTPATPDGAAPTDTPKTVAPPSVPVDPPAAPIPAPAPNPAQDPAAPAAQNSSEVPS